LLEPLPQLEEVVQDGLDPLPYALRIHLRREELLGRPVERHVLLVHRGVRAELDDREVEGPEGDRPPHEILELGTDPMVSLREVVSRL